MIRNVVASAVISGSFAAAIVYCLVLLAAGLTVLRVLGLERARCASWSISGYLGTAFALGSGIVGSVWLSLAVLHWLFPAIVLALCLVFIVAGVVLIRPLAAEIRKTGGATGKMLARDTWPWRICTLLTLYVIGAYGIAAFHPAIGDSVAFYLPWSRIIAASGRMMRLPGYEGFSDIWTLGEMHAAAAMTLVGDWVARTLPYLDAIAAAVVLWGIGQSAGLGLRGRLITVAMLFTSTNIGFIIWDGKFDLVALPIGLAAIYTALHLRGETVRRVAVVTGLLSGFAVAAKLSYVVPLGIAVLIIALWRASQRFGNHWITVLARAAPILAVIGASLCIAIVPQIAKNWAMSGEPFAPIFYFGVPGIDTDQVYYTTATTIRLVLTYPLVLIFGNYWNQHGNLSVLLPAFLPLGFIGFAHRPRRDLWALTAAAILGLFCWTALWPSTFAPRYYLVVLVVPFLFAADGAARASFAGSWPIRTMVVLTLAFALVESARSLANPVSLAWKYAASADTVSYDGDDSFNMARLLNASAPPGTRVALLGFYRYPLRADLLECAFSQAQVLKFPSFGKRIALEAYLEGADYLAIDLMPFKTAIPNDFAELPSWLHVEQIYKGPRVWIYRLTGAPESPPRRAQCVRDRRVWAVGPTAVTAAGPAQ